MTSTRQKIEWFHKLIEQVPEIKGNPGEEWVDIGRAAPKTMTKNAVLFEIFKGQWVPVSLIRRDEQNNILIRRWKYDQIVDKMAGEY